MFVRRKRIFNATIYYFLQFLGVKIIYALFFSVLALEVLVVWVTRRSFVPDLSINPRINPALPACASSKSGTERNNVMVKSFGNSADEAEIAQKVERARKFIARQTGIYIISSIHLLSQYYGFCEQLVKQHINNRGYKNTSVFKAKPP